MRHIEATYNRNTMKPRIAIPVPTTGDAAYNALNWPAYADAVSASGGEPVRFALGLSRGKALELAEVCQGFLLPGSPADVSAAKYGQEKDPASASADDARESVDELLIEGAEQSGRPLLAICFGAQMLNVIRGGTVIQDLGVLPVNHTAGRSVGVAHTAALSGSSLLALLSDGSEVQTIDGVARLPVNSSHHQAIGIPGEGLRVSARCPQDGVVEAVEDVRPGRFLLGVQWHPERTYSSSATSRRLFSRLIEEASAWDLAGVLASA